MNADGLNRWGAVAIVAIAVLANLPGLIDPAIFHDEVVTVQLTAGNPEPTWPQAVEPAGKVVATAFDGSTRPTRLVNDLLRLDVHPPVYFLAVSGWRTLFGRSLEALRAFSVLTLVIAGMALRATLRRAGHPAPNLTSVLFVSLSGLVVVGQVARPYGLALCLLCLAAWCAAVYLDSSSWLPALGCAAFGSLAFLTSYLAIFPLVVILAVLALRAWTEGGPKSRLRGSVVPLLVGVSWLPWAGFIARQSVSRPTQEAGFAGWLVQLQDLWRGYETMLWVAYHPWRQEAVGILVALGLIAWFRLRRPADSALTWLLLAWAGLPALGVLALNLGFDKHLEAARYFVFATPGIAGLAGYLLARVPRAWLAWGLFVGLQIVSIVRFDAGGTSPSSLAAKVAQEGAESTIVLVGSASSFSGYPGQVVYQLDKDIPVLVLDGDDDLAQLQAHVRPYRQVWLLAPPGHVTRGLENLAFQQLLESKEFLVVQANETACQLRRPAPALAPEPIAGQAGPSLQSRPRLPDADA